MGYFWAWLIPCVLGYIFLSWVRRWIRISDIQKKYVLITGCDTGFGNLLAQRLDMLGCHVFAACLTDSGKNRLQLVTSKRLKAFTMNVTRDEDVAHALDFVTTHLPKDEGLWGLVNNAGVLGPLCPVEWNTLDDFETVYAVNAMGTIRVTMAFLALVKKAKGRIVNASSVAARISNPLAAAYNCSKAAVSSFSDSIRPLLAVFGVSVHILEPGAFRTDIMDPMSVRTTSQDTWKRCSWATKEEFGEDYLTNLGHMTDQVTKGTSSNVNLVVKAYVHALTAVSPRTRYSVGYDATYLYIPLSYMPSFVLDWMFGLGVKSLVPESMRTESQRQAKVVKVKLGQQDATGSAASEVKED